MPLVSNRKWHRNKYNTKKCKRSNSSEKVFISTLLKMACWILLYPVNQWKNLSEHDSNHILLHFKCLSLVMIATFLRLEGLLIVTLIFSFRFCIKFEVGSLTGAQQSVITSSQKPKSADGMNNYALIDWSVGRSAKDSGSEATCHPNSVTSVPSGGMGQNSNQLLGEASGRKPKMSYSHHAVATKYLGDVCKLLILKTLINTFLTYYFAHY